MERVRGVSGPRAQAVRRLGSAALDLCYVAAGRFDGFWEEQLHPWDIAAGALIVEEAGGVVSNYAGRACDIFQGQIAVSNGLLHRSILDAIAAVWPRGSGGDPGDGG